MSLPDWWARVDSIFRQAGVPTPVWTAIAAKESRFVPWASNTKYPDNSWGLFQLNRNGGQGAGYLPDYLKDPINNAMISAKYIGDAVSKCGPDNISCIAINSGHPGPVSPSDQRIKDIAANYAAFKGKTSEQIYATYASGNIPPAPVVIPGLPSPSDIGGAISSGLLDGIKNAWSDFWTGIEHGGIDSVAPIAFGITGVSLIGMGLFAAAFQSKTVRTVVATAATDNPAMGAIAGAMGETQMVSKSSSLQKAQSSYNAGMRQGIRLQKAQSKVRP